MNNGTEVKNLVYLDVEFLDEKYKTVKYVSGVVEWNGDKKHVGYEVPPGAKYFRVVDASEEL